MSNSANWGVCQPAVPACCPEVFLQAECTARASVEEGRNAGTCYRTTLLGEGSAEGGFLMQGLRQVQLLLFYRT